MFCPNCGAENPDYANFCEKCGATLEPAEGLPAEGAAQEGTAALRTEEKKKQLIIGGSILLVAVLVCIAALIWHTGEKKGYESKLQNAGRYLQELNYEKAEAAFLDAIQIDPKREESYIQLADLYMKQGRREEAAAVLRQGQKQIGTESAALSNRIEEIESGGDSYTYVEESLVPESGLADLGTFPDDESNRLGLVSAWIKDFNGDGKDDVLTTIADEHKVTDMRITLFEKNGEDMRLAGELPAEVSAGEVSYGDSSCEIFGKEQEGSCYLVARHKYASQSYSSSSTIFYVFNITQDLKTECYIELDWNRGNSSVSINGDQIASISDGEQEESGETGREAAMEKIKEALRPYGLEEKVSTPEEPGLDSGILLTGYDEEEASETPISNRERKQTGQYSEGHPDMEVVVEDFTDIRGYLGVESEGQADQETSPESGLYRAGIAQCVGMSKSAIEEQFGALSEEGSFQDGGEGFPFESGYEGITVYFQAFSELPDEENLCTALDGSAGELFEGWETDSMTLDDFARQCGVSIQETEGIGYGEFDDGTRMAVYSDGSQVTTDTIVRLMPSE